MTLYHILTVGVDMSKPPSTMQMMKLGMDPEIREAGSNVSSSVCGAGGSLQTGMRTVHTVAPVR